MRHNKTVLASLFLILAATLFAAWPLLLDGINFYDEGLSLTAAQEIMRGHLPAADFYFPYPPAAPMLLAALFALLKPSVYLGRMFTFSLIFAWLGTLSFLALRTPRARLGVLTLVLCTAPSALLLASESAGCLLILFIVGILLPKALQQGSVCAAIYLGSLLGIAALWRVDFAFYGAVATAFTWFLRARGAAVAWTQRCYQIATMALSAMALSFPVFAALAWLGGTRALQSLFVWPLISTAHATLPWPAFQWHNLSYTWPFYFPLWVMLCFATLLLLKKIQLTDDIDRGLWLLILSMGLLVYAAGRSDVFHLAPLLGTCAPLAALCLCNKRITLPILAGAALLLPMSVERWNVAQANIRGGVSLSNARAAGIIISPSDAAIYADVLNDIATRIPQGSTFYSAAARHDVFMLNDQMLYFLSERSPPTYFFCLDAGLTTEREIQQQMIADFNQHSLNWIVTRKTDVVEDALAGPGSSLLDQTIDKNFKRVQKRGTFSLLNRHSPRSPLALQ